MSVSLTHVFRQGPVIKALIRTAVAGVGTGPEGGVPGPVLKETLPPRNARMVADYIRHTGGSPKSYGGALPPHLFPQWCFPMIARCIKGVPYDMKKVLNAGCRLEVLHPLPVDRKLLLKGQLVGIDDNGSLAILRSRIVTGTAEHPESLISYVNAVVPLKRSKGPKKEKPRVPEGAREIDRWKLSATAGRDFALLTGDFNPIHWVPMAARMAGFKNVILHGYASVGRTLESLNRQVFSGRPGRLATFECRFVRPLVLPARPGVFIDGQGGIFLGDAPGGPAYFTGNYTVKPEEDNE